MLKDFQTCKNSSFITPYKLLLDFGSNKSSVPPNADVKYKKQQMPPPLPSNTDQKSENDIEIKTYSNSRSGSFKNSNLLSQLNDLTIDLPKKQSFKLNHMVDDVQEQNKFIKEQQSQINYKMFYSHFDDSYKDIMEYINTEKNESQRSTQKSQKDNQIKPRFKKVTTIRPEILFNIKQMIRMQRIRAEKIYKEEIKPDEMIEYMRKRNQIEIILENSKKIQNLKVVADLIEKEIEVQNEKINTLVSRLIQKFGLESYQEESEKERLQLQQ